MRGALKDIAVGIVVALVVCVLTPSAEGLGKRLAERRRKKKRSAPKI